MRFTLQRRAILKPIWYTALRYDVQIAQSNEVSELREEITRIADTTTLPFRQHYRVITSDGDPVERWVVTPGRARRTRRKY